LAIALDEVRMKQYPRLTASRINASASPEHDVWLSDAGGWRGLGQLLVRITPRGTRHFYFRYTSDGRRKTISLGRYSRNRASGFLTLTEARDMASQLSSSISAPSSIRPGASIALGPASPTNIEVHSSGGWAPGPRGAVDPHAQTENAGSAVRLTLTELCQIYIQWLKDCGKESWRDLRNLMKPVTTSELGTRFASEVSAAEISKLLRKMVEQGKGRSAQKVRSVLHTAYTRALGAELSPTSSGEAIDPSIRFNPISGIPSMSEFSKPRRRALNKSELREFWRRLSIDGTQDFQPLAVSALRLDILLGGQRYAQLRRVKLADVDLDAGTILLMDPKGQRTHARAHLLPLCVLAKREVERLVRRSQDMGSTYLLAGSSPKTSISDVTISKHVREISIDMISEGQSSSRFQFSDLRRTAETTLASLGVHKDIRAQLQSHGISGVQAKHYDMYDYMKEKAESLQMWEDFLTNLLD
jgi:integrase